MDRRVKIPDRDGRRSLRVLDNQPCNQHTPPMPKHASKSPPSGAVETDVLVVGGGLVGGTLACALASHGVSVATVDAADPASLLAVGHDGRSSAVALACRNILDAVGVWEHMRDEVQPILDIRIADGDSPMFLHYDHRSVGEPMGWMAPNRIMRRAIMQRMSELPGARHIAPARMVRVDRAADGIHAVLADGREIKARLVVAADGRLSPLRDQAGIKVVSWPYGQLGLVMTVRHEKDHEGVAYEHFLPSGPFAILPLPGGHHSSLVWTEKEDLGRHILGLPDDLFHVELVRRFGGFLGNVDVVSERFGYPLVMQFADRYVDKRLVLVGDAAHGMHPVAGQGMNFGLRDVAALTERIVEAKRLGLDIGGASVLEPYQRWRRFDNLLMLGLTDGIVRLFSNDIAPIRAIRGLGLAAVQRMPGLKTFFMRHAMGQVGELPKLMRGTPL